MQTLRLIRSDTGDCLAHRIRPARDLMSRLRGLLGLKTLPQGHGLWLVPCNSIHMWGMRFPIDVLFLDRNLRVVKSIVGLQPGAVVWPVRNAHSAVELGPGTLENVPPLDGVKLAIQEAG